MNFWDRINITFSQLMPFLYGAAAVAFMGSSFLALGCTPKQARLDKAYPTVPIQITSIDLDCSDISYRNFKVLPPDRHRFDGDGNGIGCEE